MSLKLKQCPLAFGSRTLAAWVVVVLALSYSARSSQAGVIVCDDQSIRTMAAVDLVLASDCEPQGPPLWMPRAVLAAGPTDSGFGTSNTVSHIGVSGNLALFLAAFEPYPPEVDSAVHGEGPLFFRPPPVFELLRPPKV